jgi:hypothetical protein
MDRPLEQARLASKPKKYFMGRVCYIWCRSLKSLSSIIVANSLVPNVSLYRSYSNDLLSEWQIARHFQECCHLFGNALLCRKRNKYRFHVEIALPAVWSQVNSRQFQPQELPWSVVVVQWYCLDWYWRAEALVELVESSMLYPIYLWCCCRCRRRSCERGKKWPEGYEGLFKPCPEQLVFLTKVWKCTSSSFCYDKTCWGEQSFNLSMSNTIWDSTG